MHDGADVLNDGIGHGLCFFEKSASTPIAVKKKKWVIHNGRFLRSCPAFFLYSLYPAGVCKRFSHNN